jgi:hypothetical protein
MIGKGRRLGVPFCLPEILEFWGTLAAVRNIYISLTAVKKRFRTTVGLNQPRAGGVVPFP